MKTESKIPNIEQEIPEIKDEIKKPQPNNHPDHVDLELTSKPNSIEIDGGEGVGRVTKPGIGLEIGQAAINPTPRKMITENLTQVGKKILEKNGIKVVISVPKGKELGPKTDNPRIGIIGGISILGTSGIVIPYSTASFAASIRQQLDVVL